MDYLKAYGDYFTHKLNPQNWGVKNQKVTTYNSKQIGGQVTFMGADGNTYIKDGYQSNPHLYSAIRLLIRSFVKFDYVLYEVEDGTTKRKLKNNPFNLSVKAKDKMEVGEHDLLHLLYNPNSSMGKTEFLENVLGYKLITGKSYIHQLWPDGGVNKGIPTELYILAPPLTSVKYDEYGAPLQYTVKVGNDKTDIPAEEVIALNYFNPLATDNTGQSPVMAARKTLTQSNNAYTANSKILQNGGAGGILTYTTTDPTEPFDVKKQQKLEDKYYSRYGGTSNYGKIMVTNAITSWQQIGLPAADLDLINSQKLSLRDICNLYGISSQLLNDPDNKTYSNMNEARKELISVVVAEIKDYLAELNRTIVPKYEERDNKKYYLGADLSVYPELKEDEVALYTMLTSADFLTTDEKRHRAGLEELGTDAAQEVLIPTSKVPLGMSEEALLNAALNQGGNG